MSKVTRPMLIKIVYKWDGHGTNPMSKMHKDKFSVLVIPVEDSEGMTYRVSGAVHAVAQWLIAITGELPSSALWWLRSAQPM
jgi:hypothetical protein